MNGVLDVKVDGPSKIGSWYSYCTTIRTPQIIGNRCRVPARFRYFSKTMFPDRESRYPLVDDFSKISFSAPDHSRYFLRNGYEFPWDCSRDGSRLLRLRTLVPADLLPTRGWIFHRERGRSVGRSPGLSFFSGLFGISRNDLWKITGIQPTHKLGVIPWWAS